MSAAQRSVARRLLSGLFFALALALLIGATLHGQVYLPDPCKTTEPGSIAWYLLGCWIPGVVDQVLDLLVGAFSTAPTGFLVR
jgi:hypothetical protein